MKRNEMLISGAISVIDITYISELIKEDNVDVIKLETKWLNADGSQEIIELFFSDLLNCKGIPGIYAGVIQRRPENVAKAFGENAAAIASVLTQLKDLEYEEADIRTPDTPKRVEKSYSPG